MPIELKTINEVKDEVARKYDYNTFGELIIGEVLAEDWQTLTGYIDEAMKAYGEHLLDYTTNSILNIKKEIT